MSISTPVDQHVLLFIPRATERIFIGRAPATHAVREGRPHTGREGTHTERALKFVGRALCS